VDIEPSSWMTQCQAKGVKVILSMGGAVGNYGFSSAADATAYAPLCFLWFLSSLCVDIDGEAAGSSLHFV